MIEDAFSFPDPERRDPLTGSGSGLRYRQPEPSAAAAERQKTCLPPGIGHALDRRCSWCGRELRKPCRGPWPKTCGARCRQAAYRDA